MQINIHYCHLTGLFSIVIANFIGLFKILYWPLEKATGLNIDPHRSALNSSLNNHQLPVEIIKCGDMIKTTDYR